MSDNGSRPKVRPRISGPVKLLEVVKPSPLVLAPRPKPEIWPADSVLTWGNRLDHAQARWGYQRGRHRVKPGLYALGHPTPQSAVFVTANYTLSFDALRTALVGRDAYLLVLDTKGINVWCAAGKGTFGTNELVHRIEATRLSEVVDHRTLIVPQLGASGVSAHVVRQRSGFRVEYGPIRAADLPRYLDTGQAAPEMRRVTFTLGERVVLIPMELVHTFLPMVAAATALYFLAGLWGAVGAVTAVLAGVVLFPISLPWLPTREFSTKGFILGGLVALPIALLAHRDSLAPANWQRFGSPVALWLGITAVVAFLALNFTGSTPLTSKTGVKREMSRYIPWMAGMAGLGVLWTLIMAIIRWIGG